MQSKHKSSITRLFIVLGVLTSGFYVNNNELHADTRPYEVPPPLISVTETPQFDFEEIECLALNAYFEAGIEGYAGKLAVSNVVINRVKSPNFPDTICGVVQQGRYHANGQPKRNQCQFSWWCDGKSDNPYEGQAWEDSKKIALDVYASNLNNANSPLDITEGSLYYHADYVVPYWAKSMKRVVKIDTHIFYK
jgi:spore germination cell wall hydrolase CwlJ-like protein